MQRIYHLYTLVQRSTKGNFAQLCIMPYPRFTSLASHNILVGQAAALHFEVENRESSQVTLQVKRGIRL